MADRKASETNSTRPRSSTDERPAGHPRAKESPLLSATAPVGISHRQVANPTGRSRTDLMRWAGYVMARWGLRHERGFHVIEWAHDDWCSLHPDRGSPDAWSRCQCEPDGTLVLHVGTPHERRVQVVRNGISVAESSRG